MYGYDEITRMSIAAIKKLNAAGIKCITLTKGLLPIELATLFKDNEHGITLIYLDESYCEKKEPGASSCKERLSY
jgi:DNA repair photolyase